MLMSAQSNKYAIELLTARAEARQIPLLSTEGMSLADAYDIAKNIQDIRIAQGESLVGRKIGFSNKTLWSKYGLQAPIDQIIWAPLFDSTIRYTEDNHGTQSLEGAVQPRIQPEIIVKLGATPEPDATVEAIAECIEWMAHGIEIVVCPFADWKFDLPDAVAAFGLHGTLIIGEQKVLSAASRRNLGEVLAMANVSASCSTADTFTLCGAGFGSDVSDSPVHALWYLHQMLQSQPQFAPLAAGEIIATGSLTDSYPIHAGETWMTAFSGVTLSGMTLSFV